MPSIILNQSTSICALKDFLRDNKDVELYTKNTKAGIIIKTGAKNFIFKDKMDARRAQTRRALITFVKAKNPKVVAREFASFLAPDDETVTPPLYGRQVLVALAESQYTPLINMTKDQLKTENSEGIRNLKNDLDAVGWQLQTAKPERTFFTEMSLWASDHVKAAVLPPPPFQNNPRKFNLALNYAKHSAIKDTLFSDDAAQYQTLENETREFIDRHSEIENDDLHDLFTKSGMVSSAALRETLNSPNTLIRNIEIAAKDFIKQIEDKPKTAEQREAKSKQIHYLARDIRVSNAKMLNRIKFGARLFTDERYLLLYPESQRFTLRAIGKSMEEMAKELENHDEAFQAFLSIASAAELHTEPFLDTLSELKGTAPTKRRNWVDSKEKGLRKHQIFKRQIDAAPFVNSAIPANT